MSLREHTRPGLRIIEPFLLSLAQRGAETMKQFVGLILLGTAQLSVEPASARMAYTLVSALT